MGPTACTPSSIRKRSRSAGVGEPDEHERVVAHDQVRVERHLAADRPASAASVCAETAEAVADAAAQQRDVLAAALGDLAAHHRDHRAATASSASASGARLAWQIGDRERVGGVIGGRQVASAEQRGDHPRDLVLRRGAAPAHRALDLLRRVGEARTPRCPAQSIATPRACPTAKALRAFAPK